jgi:hypothetical protein
VSCPYSGGCIFGNKLNFWCWYWYLLASLEQGGLHFHFRSGLRAVLRTAHYLFFFSFLFFIPGRGFCLFCCQTARNCALPSIVRNERIFGRRLEWPLPPPYPPLVYPVLRYPVLSALFLFLRQTSSSSPRPSLVQCFGARRLSDSHNSTRNVKPVIIIIIIIINMTCSWSNSCLRRSYSSRISSLSSGIAYNMDGCVRREISTPYGYEYTSLHMAA